MTTAWAITTKTSMSPVAQVAPLEAWTTSRTGTGEKSPTWTSRRGLPAWRKPGTAARDYGDVHVVQLHNEPTYTTHFSTSSFFQTTAYEITASLDWLERDLQQARAQGKIILLNLHQPFHWPVRETEIFRFTKMIEDYGVTAVFSANANKQSGKYESSNYIYGDTPLFMSGSAVQQSWLYATFSADRTQMTVNVVAGNDWRKPVATHTVPVK